MGLNGPNGSGKCVEEETDKRKRGARSGLMYRGTREEAVWRKPLSLQCQGPACKRVFFALFSIQYPRDVVEGVRNK